MPNTITFTSGNSSVAVTPVPGTVKAGGGHDDRGGGTIPPARAGFAMNGSCQVVVTQASADNLNHTVSNLKSIVSDVGEGSWTVTGDGIYNPTNGSIAKIKSYNALVDVVIEGDSVQTATIEWKGSYNPTTPSVGE